LWAEVSVAAIPPFRYSLRLFYLLVSNLVVHLVMRLLRSTVGSPRTVCARALWAVALGACVCMTLGCRTAEKMVKPSHFRDWTPEQAVLPTAEVRGSQVTVHNIRNCQYFANDTFLVNYYDKTFDLASVRSVDFLMVPFEEIPSLAHTMISFEIEEPDGRSSHLAVSVETRKEKYETYNPIKGSARQYELMYVVADERDVIRQRTNYRNENVYLYRTVARSETAQLLLTDVLGRVNQIAKKPEFYDTIANNCTTNIVRHINRVRPNRLGPDVRLLLPGYSDKIAYDQGLIVPYGTFAQTKQRAYINPLAERYSDREDFSELIRR
jgi:hypothetical protein